MKDCIVRFKLYNVSFDSRPMTRETAEEMVRQLADRDIKEAVVRPATPREMWMILNVDKGDGYHRVDTSGLQVYASPDVAREDLNRFLFKTGYAVVPLTVLQQPYLLGTQEQREAWEAKEKK